MSVVGLTETKILMSITHTWTLPPLNYRHGAIQDIFLFHTVKPSPFAPTSCLSGAILMNE